MAMHLIDIIRGAGNKSIVNSTNLLIAPHTTNILLAGKQQRTLR